MRRYGFTLIELLIVVAIIAILAAIAVPNFLEAQTRAKVSRCQADMRTIATAMETYTVDFNKPMPEYCLNNPTSISGKSVINSAFSWNCVSCRFMRLTTPVAYMTTVPPEPFAVNGVTTNPPPGRSPYDTYDYFSDSFVRLTAPDVIVFGAANTSGATWRVAAAGPDRFNSFGGAGVGSAFNLTGVDYDATNGTVSKGDIVRISSARGKIVRGLEPGIDRISLKYNDPAL